MCFKKLKRATYKFRKNRQIHLFVVYFFVLMLVPIAIAHAVISLNFISKNDSALSSEFQVKTERINNSQNLELLKNTRDISPQNPRIGGGDILILQETALYAETGVSGTVLDIEKNKNNSGKISLYEVREGDSLSRIAEMFGVSVNTIKWANELTGSIQPGQNLIILPVSGISHKVKNGGTITDLAKIYGADAQEIALFNGLAVDTVLNPGDEIIVPNVDLSKMEDDKKEEVRSSGTQTRIAVAPANVSYAGYYTNPLPGTIVTQALHGYNAVDFGAPYGTPVLAAASGAVITSRNSGWNGGYGNMIVVSHDNGTQTLYSHMSSNSVYSGQRVQAGQVIGYVGSTGQSTGNHLHFEVRGARNPWANCAVGRVCR